MRDNFITRNHSLSWGSVFGGSVTVLAVLLVLNLLGLSVGLFSFNPASDANPGEGLGTGSFIWWILSNIIALFLGGFVSGRVGTSVSKSGGMIHGFLSWALYTLISVWLLTSAIGSIFSGLGNIIGGVTKGATSITSAVVGYSSNNNNSSSDGFQFDWNNAKENLEQLLKNTGKSELNPNNLKNEVDEITDEAKKTAENVAKNPNDADDQLKDFFDKLKADGKNVMDVADKDALVSILKNKFNMSEAEAKSTVEQYSAQYEKLVNEAKAKYEEVKQETLVTTEKVTNTSGSIALWSAITLIFGAVAAIFGGAFGTKKRLEILEKNNIV